MFASDVLDVLLPYLEFRDITLIEALGQWAQEFLNERFVVSELRVLRDDISSTHIQDSHWWGRFIDRCAPVLKRLVLDSETPYHGWGSSSLLHNVLLSLMEKGMPRLEQCVLALDFTSICLGTAENPIDLPQLRYLNLVGSKFKFVPSENGFIYINAPRLEFLAVTDRARPFVHVLSKSSPCLIRSILTRGDSLFPDCRDSQWEAPPAHVLEYELPDKRNQKVPINTEGGAPLYVAALLPREKSLEKRNIWPADRAISVLRMKQARHVVSKDIPSLVRLALLDSGAEFEIRIGFGAEFELRIFDQQFSTSGKAWHNLVQTADLSRIPPWLIVVPYLERSNAKSPHPSRACSVYDVDLDAMKIRRISPDEVCYVPDESTDIVFSNVSNKFAPKIRMAMLKHLNCLRKVDFDTDIWKMYMHLGRGKCLPITEGWPRGCAVLLRCRSNELPTTFDQYVNFKAIVDKCKINFISVSGYPSDIKSLFWTYIVVSQAAHNVRAVFQRLSVIPRRWRAAVYEMASGVYTVEVLNKLLSIVGLSSADLRYYLHGDDHLLFKFPPWGFKFPQETWHSVGLLRPFEKDEFASFYKAMLRVLPIDAYPYNSFDEISCVGRLKLGSRWLNYRLATGRYEELADWGVPPIFPVISPENSFNATESQTFSLVGVTKSNLSVQSATNHTCLSPITTHTSC